MCVELISKCGLHEILGDCISTHLCALHRPCGLHFDHGPPNPFQMHAAARLGPVRTSTDQIHVLLCLVAGRSGEIASSLRKSGLPATHSAGTRMSATRRRARMRTKFDRLKRLGRFLLQWIVRGHSIEHCQLRSRF